jgi:two-component sensor histidine kinase/response regulator of citrate/malate metabolism
MEPDVIRVLLVEDDADDYALTRAALAEIEGHSYDLEWVPSCDAARAAMRRGRHDIYLFDYRLGARSGLELLREVVAQGCSVPIILLTGQGDREVDIEAMRAGAADFVSKDRVDAALLERSIRYAIAHKHSEEELRRMHEELERRVEERTAQLAQANRVLQAEIAERQRAETQLLGSLQEKEVLLREIHHRVKNNLQIISSLLNLQAKYIKDSQALEMFKESQNRVKSMAMIHEKLYRARDLAHIDMAEYVRTLADHLFRSYGVNARAVVLQIDVADVVLGIDTVIPCGLLIHELVSNALKHAFPAGKGELTIELRAAAQGRFVLRVSDDGIGLPRGFDYRRADSLGLQLVTALAGQVDGTVDVANQDGTTFTITFPELKYAPRR